MATEIHVNVWKNKIYTEQFKNSLKAFENLCCLMRFFNRANQQWLSIAIWQNNCALRSCTEKRFLSIGCRNFSRWQIAASTRILSCFSTSPQMQQDCRPLNVKWINKASALSSRAILEGLEGRGGAAGAPEDLCTTSWHHTRDFFPFLNLSSPTPTSRDSCDTTWGNLSHFTGVTKGLFGPSRGKFADLSKAATWEQQTFVKRSPEKQSYKNWLFFVN